MALTFDLDPTLNLQQGNSDAKIRFLAFDLDLWPMTSTYHPNLAKVIHTEYQGRRSNGLVWEVGHTNGRTNGFYQVHYLPASRSIRKYPVDTIKCSVVDRSANILYDLCASRPKTWQSPVVDRYGQKFLILTVTVIRSVLNYFDNVQKLTWITGFYWK